MSQAMRYVPVVGFLLFSVWALTAGHSELGIVSFAIAVFSQP